MCHFTPTAFKKPSLFLYGQSGKNDPTWAEINAQFPCQNANFATSCLFRAHTLFPRFSPLFPSLFPASFPLFCPFFPLFFPLVLFVFMQPKRKMKKQFLKSLKQLFHPKGLFGTVLSQYRTILGGRVGSFNRGKGAVILAPVW